jgi:hypothetical protein
VVNKQIEYNRAKYFFSTTSYEVLVVICIERSTEFVIKVGGGIEAVCCYVICYNMLSVELNEGLVCA